MKIYIIKNGHLTDKETGETVESVSGKLVDIRFHETTETHVPRVRYIFETPAAEEGAEPVQAALSLERFGLAALKVTRLLAGCISSLKNGVLTVKVIRDEEAAHSVISLDCDGTAVEPIEAVPYIECYDYGFTRKMFISQITLCIAKAIHGEIRVAVVSPLPKETRAMEAIAAIESDENVKAKEKVFGDAVLFAEWKRTIANLDICVFENPADVAAVLEAHFCEEA